MYFRRSSTAARHLRFATALALAVAACQRREGIDTRVPVNLGSPDDWSLATHPSLGMSAEQLRDLTSRLFEATNRFQVTTAPATSARAMARVISVESEPVAGAAPPQVTVHVRTRLEFTPAGNDDSNTLIAVASGLARGPRAQAEASACELALDRTVQQISFDLQANTKSADELVADLNSGDSFRSAPALEHLAALRHPAAFDPLLKQLRLEDQDASLKALSSLVSFDDPRAVHTIIDVTDHRDFAFLLEALYAVGSLSGEEAEAYLETIKTGHSDPRAQAAAGEALNLARKRATVRKSR